MPSILRNSLPNSVASHGIIGSYASDGIIMGQGGDLGEHGLSATLQGGDLVLVAHGSYQIV